MTATYTKRCPMTPIIPFHYPYPRKEHGPSSPTLLANNDWVVRIRHFRNFIKNQHYIVKGPLPPINSEHHAFVWNRGQRGREREGERAKSSESGKRSRIERITLKIHKYTPDFTYIYVFFYYFSLFGVESNLI